MDIENYRVFINNDTENNKVRLMDKMLSYLLCGSNTYYLDYPGSRMCRKNR